MQIAAAETIFGVPAGELVGRSIQEFVDPAEFEKVRSQTVGRLKGETASYEMQIIRPDGKNRYLLVTVSPFIGNDGTFIGSIGVFRDLTERKLSERESERLNLQVKLILKAVGEGIIGLNMEGNHTFVNPAAARMLGYEAEELIGRHSHSSWHYARPDGTPYPSEECPIYATLRDGSIHHGEEYFFRKDGTGFPVGFTCTPIEESGQVLGGVMVFRDLTERKQSERVARVTLQHFSSHSFDR